MAILRATDGIRGRVIDLDTGKYIPKVITFDEEKGQIEAYQTDENGKEVTDNGYLLTYTAKGRFRFVPIGVDIRLGGSSNNPPQCGRCSSDNLLPGDELCALCRLQQQGRPLKAERITAKVLLVPKRCEGPNCNRSATWRVSDEMETIPQLGQMSGKPFLFERGATVGVRWYCDFHYQPPRLLDVKGEVVKSFEDAGGVRPG